MDGLLRHSSARILVVDDDEDTRLLIEDVLTEEGYDVLPCASGEKALEMLERTTFKVMLSDIKMPRVSGTELLRYVRRRGLDMEVILMTAYASVETAVQALRGEAFDYLIKPFSLDELRQRVRCAVQAQFAGSHSPMIEYCGDLSIDHNRRCVWVGDREIKLTRQEFDILACFFAHQGRVVSLDDLISEVWGEKDLGERGAATMRSAIRRLRRRIGDDARNPRYIKNVWGVGYQLGPWLEDSWSESVQDRASS